MKTFIRSNSVKFVVALFVVGIISGIIFYNISRPDLSEYITSFKELIVTTHQNTFLSSIISISAIFILSISIIGLPVAIFYLFYEALAVGYAFAGFIGLYQLKGALFYLVFFITSKLIFLIIMEYFIIFAIKYVSKFLDAFFSKNKERLYETIVYHFGRFGIVFTAVIINATFIYFFANAILRPLSKILIG